MKIFELACKMLIEFRVSNWRSFRSDTVFSLVASSDKNLPENTYSVPSLKDMRLLKSAVIYGPNASGKTNLIKAVGYLQSFVTKSTEESSSRAITATPFLMNPESSEQPTEFEVSFLVEDVRYQYGFAVDRTSVMEEWLIAYPKGSPQKWFHRQSGKKPPNDWLWGSHLRGEKVRLAKFTRDDSLFLSVAAKFNNKQLLPIYRWIENNLRILKLNVSHPELKFLFDFTAEIGHKNGAFRRMISRYLHDADLGIDGLQIERKELGEADIPDELRLVMKKEYLERYRKLQTFDVRAVHRVPGTKRSVALDIDEESDGTRRLFALLGPWLDVLASNCVLFVDELHASMHPQLTRKLLELFHGSSRNGGAQLVFTTHDTNLMDMKLFRRDQIWFTEKDRQLESHLYSLQEYSPRKDENIEKGYLAGKYGAMPIFGDFDVQ